MHTPQASTFSGRCIAVTGASRGIGAAVAQALAAAGAVVLAGARTAVPTQGQVTGLALDVRDAASVAHFVEQAAALQAEALVHCAGVGCFGPLEAAQQADYQRLMDTNVLGTLLLGRQWLSWARQRQARGLRTRLLVVTSDISTRSFANGGLYAASKHAQRALVQTLAREGAALGLDLTELRPGLTDTHFNGNTPGRPDAAGHLRPADVAAAALHVLSLPAQVRVDELVLHPVAQAVEY